MAARHDALDSVRSHLDSGQHLSVLEGTQGAERLDAILDLLRNHVAQIRPATCAELCEEALDLARQYGNRPAEGKALVMAGTLKLHAGEFDAATPYFEDSLEIFEEVGDTELQAAQLINLGICHRKKDPEQALELLHRALSTIEADNHYQLATCHNTIGSTLIGMDAPEKATPHLQDARRHAGEAGDRRLKTTAMLNQGIALEEAGNLAEAVSAYEAALGLARSIPMPRFIAAALGCLGKAWLAQGNLAAAYDATKESWSISEEVGARDFEQTAIAQLAAICEQQGAAEEAAALSKRLDRSSN